MFMKYRKSEKNIYSYSMNGKIVQEKSNNFKLGQVPIIWNEYYGARFSYIRNLRFFIYYALTNLMAHGET